MSSRRYTDLSDAQLQSLDAACARFERALKTPKPISIEAQLAEAGPDIRGPLVQELVAIELEWRLKQSNQLNVSSYESRFSEHKDGIRSAFEEVCGSHAQKRPNQSQSSSATALTAADTKLELPERIGRYRIERLLGKGSFGVVYAGRDEQLERRVAVKVPHVNVLSRIQDTGSYLDEARAVARLDHPHIVPVYDVGSSEEFPCYFVSKYVHGTSLASKLRRGQLGYRTAAELVALVARALQHAHKNGLVHRDIKPGNILVDEEGKPYLADFGLALREDSDGTEPRYAGTPAYMSPEQACGEGHRVDGRSDIFSLGAVFYELLAGRRPFRADTHAELLERVITQEPRPLRQYDEKLPKELARICSKALAKRASDRYQSAHDFAEDLDQFLSEDSAVAEAAPRGVFDSIGAVDPSPAPSSRSVRSSPGSSTLAPDSDPIRIVPKGLRSFDGQDADFFLELLPGPRDRKGVPDSIRFWKLSIEERDPDETFSIGLIYGPTGSGKSSLVKAGLLPRLSDDVVSVYIEAASDKTEARLLNGLRKRCPTLSTDLSLQGSFAAIRKNNGTFGGRKVLIVLDQFEQWLHLQGGQEHTALAQALRQCDGARLQCIVMVRDDFWLAVSRFMRELEIELVPGRNISLVDLFDRDHARRVLAALGRAFQKLPGNPGASTASQRDFLTRSVDGLATDGRVVCVQLALFAEMMKVREWTAESLKQLGGIEGVGVTFLEEAFSSRTANPEHRLHERAVRAVLQALLPESGSDIKGHMRSHDELLSASGYDHRRGDFGSVIRILDRELRLITPTDPEGRDEIQLEGDSDRSDSSTRYYQLTHDYLVPSLREWLTRRQRETFRGRAELRLAERSAMWRARSESRHLPTWWEYANIRVFTKTKNWSDLHRRMMRAARRLHGARFVVAMLTIVLIAVVVQRVVAAAKLRNLAARCRTAVTTLTNSSGRFVPRAIRDLGEFPREMVVDELRSQLESDREGHQTPLVYALARYGTVDVDFLVSKIAKAPVSETDNLVSALAYATPDSLKALQTAAENHRGKEQGPIRARLAIVAMRLGDLTSARKMCQLAADPHQRSTFIDELSSWHGDLTHVSEVAATTSDPALRSAVCSGVGAGSEQVAERVKKVWYPLLTRWYREDPDKAVHSTAGWLIRRWSLVLPMVQPSAPPHDDREWFLNSHGMTLLKIPAGTFHHTEDTFGRRMPKPQAITLTRPFWLADREVSVELYRRAIDDPTCPDDQKPYLYPWPGPGPRPKKNSFWDGPDEQASPTPGHPVQRVSWIEAVMFCNWLSRKEGLEPCYERTGRVWDIPTGKFEQWRLIPDRPGYRLPVAAEWEHACRAGTATNFSYGNDDRFTSQYAIFAATQAQVCGSRLPNGWGLFDLHGNVREWCQDWSSTNRHTPHLIDPLGPEGHPKLFKEVYGGDYGTNRLNLRSSGAAGAVNVFRGSHIGFRVARSVGRVESNK